MRYRPRMTWHDRAPVDDTPSTRCAARSARHRSPTIKRIIPTALRLAGPCKLLRRSTLAITQYYAYHMEWGFYRVKAANLQSKPATGGGGESTC